MTEIWTGAVFLLRVQHSVAKAADECVAAVVWMDGID